MCCSPHFNMCRNSAFKVNQFVNTLSYENGKTYEALHLVIFAYGCGFFL